jgi:hypothetical protein
MPPPNKKNKKIEFIGYDESERKYIILTREFVTGFHKRKQQAHRQKVEKAKDREKQEKRENLREKRSKLSKVIPLVDKIDLISCVGKSVLKSTNDTTTTTVTITDFDPENIE